MATVAGYILREIDKDLWDAVKERAARDGHNIRWVLLALLRSYVQHGLGYERTAPHTVALVEDK